MKIIGIICLIFLLATGCQSKSEAQTPIPVNSENDDPLNLFNTEPAIVPSNKPVSPEPMGECISTAMKDYNNETLALTARYGFVPPAFRDGIEQHYKTQLELCYKLFSIN